MKILVNIFVSFILLLTSSSLSFADWSINTLDDNGRVYGTTRWLSVDSSDNLHLAYENFVDGELKYMTNASGLWVSETVDSSGDASSHISIAIDSSNNVHISYLDSTNGDLKYATNASGSWLIKIVDSLGYVGRYPSIAIDLLNNVHIAYNDWSNEALKYATNAYGDWITITVDSAGITGKDPSIAVDSSNNVHISYWQWINDLKYATNASGSWNTEIIDSGDGVPLGSDTSIAVDSADNIHISYAANEDLKYATNASGTWNTEIAYYDADVGYGSSLAIDSSDNVHIFYHDSMGWSLVHVTNALGFWEHEIVDRNLRGDTGWYPSIVVDSSDTVHVTYLDRLNSAIKYATNDPDVQTVSAEDAYNVLTTDPTAVMFDVRTVDEHNGYCPPWDQDCGGQIDTDAAYAGTPQWTVDGVEKLPITLPYWYAGINRNTGPPEDEAQIRSIIEGALAANIIDFDTPIYLISRTAYRSYHMTEWMNNQTFTNPATDETSSFTNLFNIDADGTPNDDQGGMEKWNAASLPIFDGTIVPPQVFSGYPEDGYIETSTSDLIFAAGVLEPTTGGFVYPDVTEVLLYVDGSAPMPMTQVDEAVLRAFFSIPDDVLIPGKVYMATKYLPDGIHTWNVRATNSVGTSWNLNVLDGTVQGPDGPGQRTLTVDACVPTGNDTDCNGRDDDCDGIPDDGYLPTDTTCGLGICTATGQTECIDGAEVDTCVPGTPAETPETTCDDSQDNDCDGVTDTDDSDCPFIYTITATAGSGGSISPSGNVIVDTGSDQTFTITPQRGYQVSDVLVDGVSMGLVISYTFTNISSDHTIHAEFTKRGLRRGMRRGRRGM